MATNIKAYCRECLDLVKKCKREADSEPNNQVLDVSYGLYEDIELKLNHILLECSELERRMQETIDFLNGTGKPIFRDGKDGIHAR